MNTTTNKKVGRPKSDKKVSRLTITLDQELHDKLKTRSSDLNIPVSTMVTTLISQFLRPRNT